MLGVAGVWLGRFWSCFKTARHEHTPCGVPLLITLLAFVEDITDAVPHLCSRFYTLRPRHA